MTIEHEHIWGQWSPWTKVAFDRWHRQRDCECGMVEDDSTSNPRVAGEPPPSGTSYKDDSEDEEEYKAAIEVPSPRPVPDRVPRPANPIKVELLPDVEDNGDPLNTAYLRAIEVARLLKRAIDDREATRAKFSELVHEMGSPG